MGTTRDMRPRCARADAAANPERHFQRVLGGVLHPLLQQHERSIRADAASGFVAFEDYAGYAELNGIRRFAHTDRFTQNVDSGGFQFADARSSAVEIRAGENHCAGLNCGKSENASALSVVELYAKVGARKACQSRQALAGATPADAHSRSSTSTRQPGQAAMASDGSAALGGVKTMRSRDSALLASNNKLTLLSGIVDNRAHPGFSGHNGRCPGYSQQLVSEFRTTLAIWAVWRDTVYSVVRSLGLYPQLPPKFRTEGLE